AFGPNGLVVAPLLAAQLAAAAVVLAAGRIGWERYRQPLANVAGRTMVPAPRIPTQKKPDSRPPAAPESTAEAMPTPEPAPKPTPEPESTGEAEPADGPAGTPIEVVAAADVDDLADDAEGAGPTGETEGPARD